MKKRWSRRKFLRAGMAGSVVTGGSTWVGLSSVTKVIGAQKEEPSTGELSPEELKALGAAMDEIIPASDDMPAATEVGGLEYLENLIREMPELQQNVRRALASLENESRSRYKKEFPLLSSPERARVLDEMERHAAPGLFKVLRDCTYEAYYLQPKVWKLIGYEFHPTNERGPSMKPFDESALGEVRKRPRYYREV